MIASFSSNADAGVIVADDYKCEGDHMVIETDYGYTLAEWYSGALYEGMYVYGDLNTYSFEYLYDSEADYESGNNDIGYIYIDDYMASKRSAQEWCFD